MKVKFNLKYGQNEIDIPIPETAVAFRGKGLRDVFVDKVTIFHSATTADENGKKTRRFDRMIVDKCSIQGEYVNKPDGTIKNVVHSQTVITRDVARYKTPSEYLALSADERSRHYTVHIGDFVVFAEVDDAVNSSREFADLQERYKDNGMVVAAVKPSLFGMDIDNITFASA